MNYKNLGGLIVLVTVVACNRETPTTVVPAVSNPTPQSQISQPESVIASEADLRNVSPEVSAASAPQQFAQLDAELKQRVEKLKQQVRATTSRDEQLRMLAEESPARQMCEKFLKLDQQFPGTESARDALLFVVANGGASEKDNAITRLLTDYIELIEIDPIVETFLSEIPRPIVDRWFQLILSKATTESDLVSAAIGWATYVRQIPVFQEALAMNPAVGARIGKDDLEYIARPRSETERDAVADALNLVIERFGDHKYESDQTVREVAMAERYELENLFVGHVAPEMSGKDLDGIEFRLSDYRGKVVMLDFWGHWCPPCRALYDRERFINQTLADKPFVLLGVNSDPKLATAQQAVRKETLSWRHFWNGPEGTAGPISTDWNIKGWPTIYLIDQHGVIRYKGSSIASIDAGLQSLLTEMGHPVDLTYSPVDPKNSPIDPKNLQAASQ